MDDVHNKDAHYSTRLQEANHNAKGFLQVPQHSNIQTTQTSEALRADYLLVPKACGLSKDPS